MVRPTCGEASLIRRPYGGTSESRPRRDHLRRLDAYEIAADSVSLPADPKAGRFANNLSRSRSTIRRASLHLGARYLYTLTYADEPDLPVGEHAWDHVRDLRRKMNSAGLEGAIFVPEHGSKLGRRHWHFLSSDLIDQDVLFEMWGRGFVQVPDLRKLARQNQGLCERDQVKRAAGYLSTYLAGRKGVSVAAGKRSFSCPKGLDIPVVRFDVRSVQSGIRQAGTVLGRPVEVVWNSALSPNYVGPQVLMLEG